MNQHPGRMQILYNPHKRLLNIAKHEGLDFADLDLQFFERATIFEAKRGRMAAVGLFEGDVLTVIFQRLGSEGISIVSMRAASRSEKRRR